MKRATRFIVMCVLIGAALNVLIAWGGASDRWSKALAYTYLSPNVSYQADWLAHRPAMFTQRLGQSDARSTWGWDSLELVGDLHGGLDSYGKTGRPPNPTVPWETVVIVRAGWPMRSFAGEGWVTMGAFTAQQTGWNWAIELPPHIERTHRAIPLRPLTLGFAVNTLFFASIVAVVTATRPTLARLRDRHRQQRNRCIACKYDLRGLPHTVCPECGAILNPDRMTA